MDSLYGAPYIKDTIYKHVPEVRGFDHSVEVIAEKIAQRTMDKRPPQSINTWDIAQDVSEWKDNYEIEENLSDTEVLKHFFELRNKYRERRDELKAAARKARTSVTTSKLEAKVS